MMRHSFYTTQLMRIYGAENAAQVEARLRTLIEKYHTRINVPEDSSLTERDSILITYGDQVRDKGQAPLQSLTEFCEKHIGDIISGIHILPFFPYSSDDGFSVKDFRMVDPTLGDWEDIKRLSRSFRMMFDLVINHASAQGDWFQAYLRDESPYKDYFLNVEGDVDLTRVIRPRALPLLTEFLSASGTRRVWTTFSADQIDLNFHNPDVLLEMIDILLFYAEKGAQFIRLDAIAYLWKEMGTTCIHLPQTHAIIQLLRAVLDECAPHVRLITETNVPHHENISYFGDGKNEAQLVYNFALPPLVLHTFRTGDVTILSQWAAGLDLPSNQTTFFNFLASHDGIGLNPARGILSPGEIDGMVEQTLLHGGMVSFKQNEDGTQTPYEMNINYFDALSDPASHEPQDLQAARFMAAQAIMLCLRGIPGIYFHSLFGSRSWQDGVEQTGQKRSINREKLDKKGIEQDLKNPQSLRSQVFDQYKILLMKRSSSPAFHPNGEQRILDFGKRVLAILRISPDNKMSYLCLQNVTGQKQHCRRIYPGAIPDHVGRKTNLMILYYSWILWRPVHENSHFEIF